MADALKNAGSEKIKSFEKFWPFYLNEHQHPVNRQLHFIGSALALLSLGTAIVTRKKRFLALAPVLGYIFAWIGHFMIERNRPATFTYPAKSLLGDFKMFGLSLQGKLNAELERQQNLQDHTD